MSDDQPIPPEGKSSGTGPEEDDPPTNPQKSLPTWAWVILVILFILIGLPLLLLGVLFLGCYTGFFRF
jgi:hypothetical protein